jgi:hypothetical protein
MDIMDRRAIAIIASTVLAVSTTIPARAREADGVVAAIDGARSLLTLHDGTRYVLPDSFDATPLRPGMEIHLLYVA